uniref:hypothetical protein n=1 Tax=Paractinoplanes polyasparticus TaxID=2856853 RepID=UPI001C84B3CA|nr:hypothetical protein [Actinoplanes polyasparticus]
MAKRWEDHSLPSNLRAAARSNLYIGMISCLLGVGITVVGYMELWSWVDLLPGSQSYVVQMGFVFLGIYAFQQGERNRWRAQVASSRLSDYRRLHAGIGAAEPVFGPQVIRGTYQEYTKWFAVGAVLTSGGVFTVSACFLPPPEGLGPAGWWALRAFFVLLGAFNLIVAKNAFRRAVRLRVGVIPSFTPLPAGSYVLYLRNFSDDPQLAKPFPMLGLRPLIPGLFMLARSEEERLETALRWAGSPMIAVGVPGERAPNNGILRMQLPNDWQAPVRKLVRDARLVVLVLGRGAGTLWELGEVMRELPPERLVLVNPMKRAKYEEFRSVAREALHAQADELERTTGHRWTPPELPDPPADRRTPSRVRGIIHWSRDWKPTYVPLPRVLPPEDYLLGALDRALWAPMLQMTEHERRVGAPHG